MYTSNKFAIKKFSICCHSDFGKNIEMGTVETVFFPEFIHFW